MNNECYNLKLTEYDNGLFDKSIDATYIIFLEGNTKRYENIENQLKKYKPTKKVYILYNKGWKKCQKDKYITNTAKDLVDCNIFILKHAQKKNYDNILILEDDFMFDNNIKNENIIQDIDNFLLKNINRSFSFYLGTLPFIFMPYSNTIHIGLLNIYTHSVIFSKKYREKILKYNYKTIDCWDIFQNKFNMNKYYYNIPLSYQVIEDTENSKNWPVCDIIRKLYLKIAMLLSADKDPKLFFKIFYYISYILTILLILIIVIILYYIYKIFKNKLFRKNFF